ncbi:hypothetical protein CEXT_488591 [Caerostris extrusa]|uniref:Uncharacterized protein n=1 Tax=Caerostris extrusa TaxID=172846 RepID=A0AAV4PJ17_CAEEX|nr:hypothetical protein CEXT_488591 [Caerostris extrusa]
MSSLECSETKALDNFEACLTSSFSPVCHRTRNQLANREIKSVSCQNDFSLVNDDSGGVFQIVENVLLEHEVLDTVIDMLNRIPSTFLTPLDCALHLAASLLWVFSSGHATHFFQDGDSENSLSNSRPSYVALTPVVAEKKCSVTSELIHDSAVKEVALMPTEHNHASDGAEVTLFPSASESPLFSAGGLERHLFAVHRINLNSHDDLPPTSEHSSHVVDPPEELLRHGMSTGPPSCASFTKIVPAKSWAAIVAKPAISTTQPWAGLPLTPHTSFSSTPRRPGQTRPTLADGSAAIGGSPHKALPPVQRVRKENHVQE